MLCLVAQLCLTLFDPMDYSLLGSSVHGDSPGKNTGVGCYVILQGISPTQGSNSGPLHYRLIPYHLSHQGSPRILEWVACPFSRGSFHPRNWNSISCIAGFPGSSDGKESACSAGDPGSIPRSGRSPGEGIGYPLQSVFMGFPGGSDGKESTCNVGALGSIPGLGQSPGGGHGNPL